MISALVGYGNRLVEHFRPHRELSPREVFQFRFLVGSALLGLVVVAFSVAVSVFTGPWLSTVFIAVFGAGLVALLLGVRAGVSMPILSWCCLLLLGLFLLADSLILSTLHEGQLRWLVLLPMVSMILAGSARNSSRIAPPVRAVGLAALLALLLGVAIVAAHGLGWTAGVLDPPSGKAGVLIGTMVDYVMFVVSVTGLIWVYTHAVRKSEAELHLLRQMLSVCAWCKRIRDDHEGWIPMEQYLVRNQATGLTHGICPDCAKTELQGHADPSDDTR